MDSKYIFAVAILVGTCLYGVNSQQGQQGGQQQGGQQQGGGNKCIEDFSNTLLGCVREAQLTDGEFLWFVSNGTSKRGTAPSDEAAFKTKICGAQQAVGQCTFQKMIPVINSTACVGTSQATNQQQIIQTQLTSVFSTYDGRCMHPCRNTLATELRECYDEAGLDPQLFLSNATNGAVVGTTKDQVETFCGAKDALISCMNSHVDACPEAPQILRVIDLDIPSFQKGVSVLCAHPTVYLEGLKCFEDATDSVTRCQQQEAQAMIQLDQQARQGNWTEDRFFQSFCEVVLKQIDCDLDAWGKKNHAACHDTVIGLRRELECELLPPQCNIDVNQISDDNHACHGDKFKKTERKTFTPAPPGTKGKNTGGAGGAAAAVTAHVAVVAVAVAFAACL